MVEMMPAHALADLCTSVISATYAEKLDVLNALDLTERFKKTLPLLLRQIEGKIFYSHFKFKKF